MSRNLIDIIPAWHERGYSPEESAVLLRHPVEEIISVIESRR